jgi:outer membrane lipoprotein-sorting protein
MTHPGTRVRPALFMLSAVMLLLSLPAGLSAQQVLTAREFFSTVAANYESVEDYVAQVVWRDESGTMRGELTYKRPDKIRIDFEDPEEQVFVSDGSVLKIYVPAYNVVLEQELREGVGSAPGGVATGEGLALMRRNYDIAYLEGPEPVPLEEDSEVFVTQLRLDRKQATEGFRQLVLSIDEEGFIRRIDGTKIDWEEVQMELADIRINQRVSDRVFEYDGDPSASTNEDFLYDPEG